MFGVKEIDPAGLKELIDNAEKQGKKVKLLDVRSQAEYAQGIIEGGEFVPLHTIPLKINDFDKDDTLVFYCRSGVRSAQACMYVAQQTGLEPLNLRGGIIAWYQSGYEIVRPDTMQVNG